MLLSEDILWLSSQAGLDAAQSGDHKNLNFPGKVLILWVVILLMLSFSTTMMELFKKRDFVCLFVWDFDFYLFLNKEI